jgi:hypothetical protein
MGREPKVSMQVSSGQDVGCDSCPYPGIENLILNGSLQQPYAAEPNNPILDERDASSRESDGFTRTYAKIAAVEICSNQVEVHPNFTSVERQNVGGGKLEIHDLTADLGASV